MQPMQVTITLDGRESELLRREAMKELRRPKDQARILLRKALGVAENHQPETFNNAKSDAGSVFPDTSAALS